MVFLTTGISNAITTNPSQDFQNNRRQAVEKILNTEKPETETSEATTVKTVENTEDEITIIISNIDYKGKPEYVELENIGTTDISLKNWRLLSVKGDQDYYFEDIIIKAGEQIRVYSGKNAVGPILWTTGNIHNNKGDAVELSDATMKLIASDGWGEYSEYRQIK